MRFESDAVAGGSVETSLVGASPGDSKRKLSVGTMSASREREPAGKKESSKSDVEKWALAE